MRSIICKSTDELLSSLRRIWKNRYPWKSGTAESEQLNTSYPQNVSFELDPEYGQRKPFQTRTISQKAGYIIFNYAPNLSSNWFELDSCEKNAEG